MKTHPLLSLTSYTYTIVKNDEHNEWSKFKLMECIKQERWIVLPDVRLEFE